MKSATDNANELINNARTGSPTGPARTPSPPRSWRSSAAPRAWPRRQAYEATTSPSPDSDQGVAVTRHRTKPDRPPSRTAGSSPSSAPSSTSSSRPTPCPRSTAPSSSRPSVEGETTTDHRRGRPAHRRQPGPGHRHEADRRPAPGHAGPQHSAGASQVPVGAAHPRPRVQRDRRAARHPGRAHRGHRRPLGHPPPVAAVRRARAPAQDVRDRPQGRRPARALRAGRQDRPVRRRRRGQDRPHPRDDHPGGQGARRRLGVRRRGGAHP